MHTLTRLLTVVLVGTGLLPLRAEAVGAAPPAATAAVTVSIARAGHGQVLSGHRTGFVGRAPASLKGASVALLRRVGLHGHWIKVAGTRVGAGGTWSAGGVPTGTGANYWVFRVKQGKTTHRSKMLKTDVYNWFYLSDLDTVEQNYWGSHAETIGGTDYNRTVYGEPFYSSSGDYADYNLGYHCTTLDAWIGLSDDSSTGSEADFYLELDGSEQDLGTKGLGVASHVVEDVSTRFRMRVGSTSDTNDTYPAFGNARLLCDTAP